MWSILQEIIIQENESIQKINVMIFKDKELYREIDLTIGEKYMVEPVKKNKKKHRGRYIQIHSFEKDYKDTIRIRVKFIDTGRLGFVELDDLNKKI